MCGLNAHLLLDMLVDLGRTAQGRLARNAPLTSLPVCTASAVRSEKKKTKEVKICISFYGTRYLVPINSSGLRITTSGGNIEGYSYLATCNISATAGSGGTFNLRLYWTYNGSEVVNDTDIAVKMLMYGNTYSVTMSFEPLLPLHAGEYVCVANFSLTGPTSFDTTADLNVTVQKILSKLKYVTHLVTK